MQWRTGRAEGESEMNDLASIVVVEDDAVIRTVLEMALAAEGFTQVASCARGDEGIKGIRMRNSPSGSLSTAFMRAMRTFRSNGFVT